MYMEKLSVNGQIFDIKDAHAVSYQAEERSEAEKSRARKNIDALQSVDTAKGLDMQRYPISEVRDISFVSTYTPGGSDVAGRVNANASVPITDENGNVISGVFEFWEGNTDGRVVLRRVAPGMQDDDAATVGQLNAAMHPVTDEKYFDIDDDGLVSLKPEYRGLGSASYLYSVSDNGAGTAGSLNSKLPEKVVIPDIINEIAVRSLAVGMFYMNEAVKSLTIPGYITEIPDRFCNVAKALEEITGTEKVETIGATAFQGTRLKRAIFPSLKTLAGNSIFSACSYLVTADIGAVTDIPKQCFNWCERLSSIRGVSSVTTIGEKAFCSTLRLKHLPFAKNLASIGAGGFYRSRVNYDWSAHGATFGDYATWAQYNTVDYWSGVPFTPCLTALRSTFHQKNPQWLLDAEAAGVPADHADNCDCNVQAYIYSIYESKDLAGPVEYISAVKAVDSSLMDISPGAFLPGSDYTQDGAYKWMTAVGYSVSRVDINLSNVEQSAVTLRAVYDALADGKLVIAGVIGANTVNGHVAHAVLLHGINDNGEVLVVDPGSNNYRFGDYSALTYAVPIQNIAASDSVFHIISKEA